MATNPCPFLVALDQCGLELQGPNMVTTAKRLVAAEDVDPGILPSDSLRYHAWDPVCIRARYTGLDDTASFELEAVFVCERGVARELVLTSGGVELHEPVRLAPAREMSVRVAVPASAIHDGTFEVAVERRVGPDAVVSELRLYSSAPVAPSLTVVGDSRGGLVGTVGDAAYAGIAGAAVSVAWPGGAEVRVETDELGIFRVSLAEQLPQGQQAELTVTTEVGGLRTTAAVDTRHLARGLHELPPAENRFDLGGSWSFLSGRVPDPDAHAWHGAATTRVPGHVAFDGLIPDAGVATLRRAIDLPADWAGSAVFARFDGAYGRAEVFVNGSLAGVHSAGATSFDVELGPYLATGEIVLTIVLTEYTPHSVLDYMSWYAHVSLLGIP